MASDRRRLSRASRLTRESELEVVRLKGKRFRTAFLEVRHVAARWDHSRAGIVVPRHSHSAAERNQVKRRIREIVRIDVLPSLGRIDFVVRALPTAYNANFRELRKDCLGIREHLVDVLSQ